MSLADEPWSHIFTRQSEDHSRKPSQDESEWDIQAIEEPRQVNLISTEFADEMIIEQKETSANYQLLQSADWKQIV
jgi:hypothetical protein